MTSALRKIIEPIVRGQLRSFIMAHPEAGLHKKWIVSIEKRITNDILSGDSALRLRAALCADSCGESRDGGLALQRGNSGTEPPATGVTPAIAPAAFPITRARDAVHEAFTNWLAWRRGLSQ